MNEDEKKIGSTNIPIFEACISKKKDVETGKHIKLKSN